MPIGATSLSLPDIVGSVNSGYDLGKQQATQGILAQYAQGAANGDQGALARIYSADPSAGMKMQQAAQQNKAQALQNDASDQQRLGQFARLVTTAYKSDPETANQLYQMGLKNLPPPPGGGQYPAQLSTTFLPHLQTIADALSPQTKKDLINLTPGSTLVDPATGKPVYSTPAATKAPQIIQTDQGYATVDPATGIATPVNYAGGAGGASQAAPQADPMTALIATANQRVRNGEDPEVVQADLVKSAQAAPGVQVGAPGANMNVSMRVMPKAPAKSPSELDQRLATARSMGATDEELKKMVLGNAGKDGTPDSLPGDTSKEGRDYLDSIPDKTVATQARALMEGRMAFPTGTALKSPYWQQMLSVVAQADPQFDAINYNSRAATRKAFTSGKESGTVNALNTVAEHIGEFSDKIQSLDNTNFRPWNSLKNSAADMTGDPRIAAFNTTKKAVADEIAKVWRSTGGSQSDIEENLKNLDGSQSTAQLNAAVGELTKLIAGKTAALQDQYTKGMGTAADAKSFVSPGAQKAFSKVLNRAGMESGNAVPSSPSVSSSSVATGSLKNYGF